MLRFPLLLAATVLIAFTSCKQQQKEPVAQPQKAVIDTIAVEKKQPAITTRFMSLVKHIDSCGYLFDTLRYYPSENSVMIVEDGYVFFEVQKENTIPFYDQMSEDSHPFHHAIEDFSTEPLQKALKISTYYFKQKVPTLINGQKWYIDGRIEEWTFANKQEAQNATNMLMSTDLTALYANTGACVCCINEQMYVFYSRATFFMTKQREFFKWFINHNLVDLHKDDSF